MAKQLEFQKLGGHGGKRKGAGRKNRTGLCAHTTRPRINGKLPLHLTFKVRKGVVSLRTPAFGEEFQRALKRAQKFNFNVVHYAVLHDHIHILAEASTNKALSQGTKSLAGRMGRMLRKMSLGQGSVFRERFHLHVLKTPTEVKRALAYVLLNLSKHRKRLAQVDPFSSAQFFDRWDKLLR